MNEHIDGEPALRIPVISGTRILPGPITYGEFNRAELVEAPTWITERVYAKTYWRFSEQLKLMGNQSTMAVVEILEDMGRLLDQLGEDHEEEE